MPTISSCWHFNIYQQDKLQVLVIYTHSTLYLQQCRTSDFIQKLRSHCQKKKKKKKKSTLKIDCQKVLAIGNIRFTLYIVILAIQNDSFVNQIGFSRLSLIRYANFNLFTAQLISVFVFAIWIEQFLFFLNLKLAASTHLLCL